VQKMDVKKPTRRPVFFKVINYLVVAGAAAGAEAAASAAAAGAEAVASAATGAAGATAAGAVTSTAGAGAGAASSFLLHATKAIANKDTNKSDFFICELSI